MNLRIFFDAIVEAEEPEVYTSNAWIRKIAIYKEEFPEWQDAKVALIGLQEDRGTLNKNIKAAPDEIRKKLFHLNQGNSDIRLVDLGNLRPGVSLEESYARLREVVEILLQHGVFPIIIGGGHDMDFAQFTAYDNFKQMVNLVNVDCYIDLANPDEMSKNCSHINSIFSHEPYNLFHYTHIAYQNFLTDQQTIDMLEKLYFESIRIGVVRENIESIEPAIRNADLISFDISAIRRSDAPGNVYAQPFGLTGEEACQLCWYAGLSSRLSSMGFYEYNPKKDLEGQTAAVVATMIWHLVEGISLRTSYGNPNELGHHLTKYIVSLPQDPHKLVFYKEAMTEKWWIEIPLPADKIKMAVDSLVPCSYDDYLLANKGEIPTRWIMAQAKLT